MLEDGGVAHELANMGISNHKFLLNCKNSKMYKIRCLNDLSVDCLSGSQLKSLFESDNI